MVEYITDTKTFTVAIIESGNVKVSSFTAPTSIKPSTAFTITYVSINTGGSDTLFKLINDKATDQAIYNWFTTKYTTANGVVLRGLVSRRKSEADLYFKK